MGDLPRMPHGSGISRTVQLQFGGLDRSPGAADGTLWDTKNLTTDELPLIASRKPRKRHVWNDGQEDTRAMCLVGGKLLSLQGLGYIILSGASGSSVAAAAVEMPDSGTPCRFISFGRDVMLMPQKLLLHTAYGASARFATLAALKAAFPQPKEGDAGLVGELNIPPEPCTVKVYAYTDGEWTDCGYFLESKELTMENKSVRFKKRATAQNVATEDALILTGLPTTNPIEAGDAIRLTGGKLEDNNKTVIVRRASATELAFYAGTFKMPEYPSRKGALAVYKENTQTKIKYACKIEGETRTFELAMLMKDDDVLAYSGNSAKQLYHYQNDEIYDIIETAEGTTYDTMIELTETYTPKYYDDTVTITRGMPELENCFADENRLWGTKGSEIYASKLGDPFNFDSFEGLSTDSYYLAVQTPGDFTAACSAYGYPTFFKTDYIYRIYGAKPDTFQLQELAASGVKQGCGESIAMANNTLIYLSGTGVMAYTGGYPERIDQALGNLALSDAAAGSDGRKYYLSAIENGGTRVLYIFDTENGTWIREQEINLVGFTASEGCLIALEDAGSTATVIWELAGDAAGLTEATETTVAATAEFGDISMQTMNRKSVHRVQLRMIVGTGASVTVAIRYDSKGDWITVKTLTAQLKQSVYLPVLPRRCDHFRLRISGTGEWKICGLALDLRQGSEQF